MNRRPLVPAVSAAVSRRRSRIFPLSSRWVDAGLFFGLVAVLGGCQPDPVLGAQGRTEPAVVTGTPEDLPTVVINEVQAKNDSTWQGADFGTPDWVELYNWGDAAVDLDRLVLFDRSGAQWQPESGSLAAGEILFLTSGEEGQLPFGIGSDGEVLTLLGDGSQIDILELGELGADLSMARFPDGGDWFETATPSPEAPNLEPSETLDPRDGVFTKDRILRIDVTLTPEAYNTMNDWSEREVPCELDVDGFHYESVSIRLKGSASFDLMDGKPAFKIDFNEYVPGTKFRNLKAIMLNNGNVMDPTRVRDHITYSLARNVGLAAPRVGWVELYVNDTYYGIYMNIETHDDVMMDTYFPSQPDGLLFEPQWNSAYDFGLNRIDFDLEEGPDILPTDSVKSMERLDALVQGPATDANIAEMWEVLDRDFLYYMAWEGVINHADGYRAPNNYRFYVNGDTHKVHFIPAGAEWTWDFAVQPWWFGGKVAQFCTQNAGCEREYAEALLEVAQEVEDMDLAQEFADISAWLDPVIQQDPRSPHGASIIANARASTTTRIAQNPSDIRQEVCTRYPSLCP